MRRDPTAFIRAFSRLSPLPASHARTLGIACHLALDMIRQGHGTDSNMNQLLYALNMAMVLCEIGIVSEHLTTITAVKGALMTSDAIRLAAGVWKIEPAAYQSICAALNVHDKQLEMATQAEIRNAEDILKSRAATGQSICVRVGGGR